MPRDGCSIRVPKASLWALFSIIAILGLLGSCNNPFTRDMGDRVVVGDARIFNIEPVTASFLHEQEVFFGEAWAHRELRRIEVRITGDRFAERGIRIPYPDEWTDITEAGLDGEIIRTYVPGEGINAQWSFILDTLDFKGGSVALPDGRIRIQFRAVDNVGPSEIIELIYNVKNEPSVVSFSFPRYDRIMNIAQEGPILLPGGLEIRGDVLDLLGLAPGYPKIQIWPREPGMAQGATPPPPGNDPDHGWVSLFLFAPGSTPPISDDGAAGTYDWRLQAPEASGEAGESDSEEASPANANVRSAANARASSLANRSRRMRMLLRPGQPDPIAINFANFTFRMNRFTVGERRDDGVVPAVFPGGGLASGYYYFRIITRDVLGVEGHFPPLNHGNDPEDPLNRPNPFLPGNPVAIRVTENFDPPVVELDNSDRTAEQLAAMPSVYITEVTSRKIAIDDAADSPYMRRWYRPEDNFFRPIFRLRTLATHDDGVGSAALRWEHVATGRSGMLDLDSNAGGAMGVPVRPDDRRAVHFTFTANDEHRDIFTTHSGAYVLTLVVSTLVQFEDLDVDTNAARTFNLFMDGDGPTVEIRPSVRGAVGPPGGDARHRHGGSVNQHHVVVNGNVQVSIDRNAAFGIQMDSYERQRVKWVAERIGPTPNPNDAAAVEAFNGNVESFIASPTRGSMLYNLVRFRENPTQGNLDFFRGIVEGSDSGLVVPPGQGPHEAYGTHHFKFNADRHDGYDLWLYVIAMDGVNNLGFAMQRIRVDESADIPGISVPGLFSQNASGATISGIGQLGATGGVDAQGNFQLVAGNNWTAASPRRNVLQMNQGIEFALSDDDGIVWDTYHVAITLTDLNVGNPQPVSIAPGQITPAGNIREWTGILTQPIMARAVGHGSHLRDGYYRLDITVRDSLGYKVQMEGIDSVQRSFSARYYFAVHTAAPVITVTSPANDALQPGYPVSTSITGTVSSRFPVERLWINFAPHVLQGQTGAHDIRQLTLNRVPTEGMYTYAWSVDNVAFFPYRIPGIVGPAAEQRRFDILAMDALAFDAVMPHRVQVDASPPEISLINFNQLRPFTVVGGRNVHEVWGNVHFRINVTDHHALYLEDVESPIASQRLGIKWWLLPMDTSLANWDWDTAPSVGLGGQFYYFPGMEQTPHNEFNVILDVVFDSTLLSNRDYKLFVVARDNAGNWSNSYNPRAGVLVENIRLNREADYPTLDTGRLTPATPYGERTHVLRPEMDIPTNRLSLSIEGIARDRDDFFDHRENEYVEIRFYAGHGIWSDWIGYPYITAYVDPTRAVSFSFDFFLDCDCSCNGFGHLPADFPETLRHRDGTVRYQLRVTDEAHSGGGLADALTTRNKNPQLGLRDRFGTNYTFYPRSVPGITHSTYRVFPVGYGNDNRSYFSFIFDATDPAIEFNYTPPTTPTFSNVEAFMTALSGTIEEQNLRFFDLILAGLGGDYREEDMVNLLAQPLSPCPSGRPGKFIWNLNHIRPRIEGWWNQLPQGSRSVVLVAVDYAGNIGRESRNFVKDTQGPNVSFSNISRAIQHTISPYISENRPFPDNWPLDWPHGNAWRAWPESFRNVIADWPSEFAFLSVDEVRERIVQERGRSPAVITERYVRGTMNDTFGFIFEGTGGPAHFHYRINSGIGREDRPAAYLSGWNSLPRRYIDEGGLSSASWRIPLGDEVNGYTTLDIKVRDTAHNWTELFGVRFIVDTCDPEFRAFHNGDWVPSDDPNSDRFTARFTDIANRDFLPMPVVHERVFHIDAADTAEAVFQLRGRVYDANLRDLSAQIRSEGHLDALITAVVPRSPRPIVIPDTVTSVYSDCYRLALVRQGTSNEWEWTLSIFESDIRALQGQGNDGTRRLVTLLATDIASRRTEVQWAFNLARGGPEIDIHNVQTHAVLDGLPLPDGFEARNILAPGVPITGNANDLTGVRSVTFTAARLDYVTEEWRYLDAAGGFTLSSQPDSVDWRDVHRRPGSTALSAPSVDWYIPGGLFAEGRYRVRVRATDWSLDRTGAEHGNTNYLGGASHVFFIDGTDPEFRDGFNVGWNRGVDDWLDLGQMPEHRRIFNAGIVGDDSDTPVLRLHGVVYDANIRDLTVHIGSEGINLVTGRARAGLPGSIETETTTDGVSTPSPSQNRLELERVGATNGWRWTLNILERDIARLRSQPSTDDGTRRLVTLVATDIANRRTETQWAFNLDGGPPNIVPHNVQRNDVLAPGTAIVGSVDDYTGIRSVTFVAARWIDNDWRWWDGTFTGTGDDRRANFALSSRPDPDNVNWSSALPYGNPEAEPGRFSLNWRIRGDLFTVEGRYRVYIRATDWSLARGIAVEGNPRIIGDYDLGDYDFFIDSADPEFRGPVMVNWDGGGFEIKEPHQRIFNVRGVLASPTTDTVFAMRGEVYDANMLDLTATIGELAVRAVVGPYTTTSYCGRLTLERVGTTNTWSWTLNIRGSDIVLMQQPTSPRRLITLVATDIASRRSELPWTFYLDDEIPSITIHLQPGASVTAGLPVPANAMNVFESGTAITGTADDNTGVRDVVFAAAWWDYAAGAWRWLDTNNSFTLEDEPLYDDWRSVHPSPGSAHPSVEWEIPGNLFMAQGQYKVFVRATDWSRARASDDDEDGNPDTGGGLAYMFFIDDVAPVFGRLPDNADYIFDVSLMNQAGNDWHVLGQLAAYRRVFNAGAGAPNDNQVFRLQGRITDANLRNLTATIGGVTVRARATLYPDLCQGPNCQCLDAISDCGRLTLERVGTTNTWNWTLSILERDILALRGIAPDDGTRHRVTLVAMDVANREAEVSWDFYLDNEGPSIAIHNLVPQAPGVTPDPPVSIDAVNVLFAGTAITGTVNDPTGIQYVDFAAARRFNGEWRWFTDLTGTPPGATDPVWHRLFDGAGSAVASVNWTIPGGLFTEEGQYIVYVRARDWSWNRNGAEGNSSSFGGEDYLFFTDREAPRFGRLNDDYIFNVGWGADPSFEPMQESHRVFNIGPAGDSSDVVFTLQGRVIDANLRSITATIGTEGIGAIPGSAIDFTFTPQNQSRQGRATFERLQGDGNMWEWTLDIFESDIRALQAQAGTRRFIRLFATDAANLISETVEWVFHLDGESPRIDIHNLRSAVGAVTPGLPVPINVVNDLPGGHAITGTASSAGNIRNVVFTAARWDYATGAWRWLDTNDNFTLDGEPLPNDWRSVHPNYGSANHSVEWEIPDYLFVEQGQYVVFVRATDWSLDIMDRPGITEGNPTVYGGLAYLFFRDDAPPVSYGPISVDVTWQGNGFTSVTPEHGWIFNVGTVLEENVPLLRLQGRFRDVNLRDITATIGGVTVTARAGLGATTSTDDNGRLTLVRQGTTNEWQWTLNILERDIYALQGQPGTRRLVTLFATDAVGHRSDPVEWVFHLDSESPTIEIFNLRAAVDGNNQPVTPIPGLPVPNVQNVLIPNTAITGSVFDANGIQRITYAVARWFQEDNAGLGAWRWLVGTPSVPTAPLVWTYAEPDFNDWHELFDGTGLGSTNSVTWTIPSHLFAVEGQYMVRIRATDWSQARVGVIHGNPDTRGGLDYMFFIDGLDPDFGDGFDVDWNTAAGVPNWVLYDGNRHVFNAGDVAANDNQVLRLRGQIADPNLRDLTATIGGVTTRAVAGPVSTTSDCGRLTLVRQVNTNAWQWTLYILERDILALRGTLPNDGTSHLVTLVATDAANRSSEERWTFYLDGGQPDIEIQTLDRGATNVQRIRYPIQGTASDATGIQSIRYTAAMWDDATNGWLWLSSSLGTFVDTRPGWLVNGDIPLTSPGVTYENLRDHWRLLPVVNEAWTITGEHFDSEGQYMVFIHATDWSRARAGSTDGNPNIAGGGAFRFFIDDTNPVLLPGVDYFEVDISGDNDTFAPKPNVYERVFLATTSAPSMDATVFTLRGRVFDANLQNLVAQIGSERVGLVRATATAGVSGSIDTEGDLPSSLNSLFQNRLELARVPVDPPTASHTYVPGLWEWTLRILEHDLAGLRNQPNTSHGTRRFVSIVATDAAGLSSDTVQWYFFLDGEQPTISIHNLMPVTQDVRNTFFEGTNITGSATDATGIRSVYFTAALWDHAADNGDGAWQWLNQDNNGFERTGTDWLDAQGNLTSAGINSANWRELENFTSATSARHSVDWTIPGSFFASEGRYMVFVRAKDWSRDRAGEIYGNPEYFGGESHVFFIDFAPPTITWYDETRQFFNDDALAAGFVFNVRDANTIEHVGAVLRRGVGPTATIIQEVSDVNILVGGNRWDTGYREVTVRLTGLPAATAQPRYTLELVVRDAAGRSNYQNHTRTFTRDNAPPVIAVRSVTTRPAQDVQETDGVVTDINIGLAGHVTISGTTDAGISTMPTGGVRYALLSPGQSVYDVGVEWRSERPADIAAGRGLRWMEDDIEVIRMESNPSLSWTVNILNTRNIIAHAGDFVQRHIVGPVPSDPPYDNLISVPAGTTLFFRDAAGNPSVLSNGSIVYLARLAIEARDESGNTSHHVQNLWIYPEGDRPNVIMFTPGPVETRTRQQTLNANRLSGRFTITGRAWDNEWIDSVFFRARPILDVDVGTLGDPFHELVISEVDFDDGEWQTLPNTQQPARWINLSSGTVWSLNYPDPPPDPGYTYGWFQASGGQRRDGSWTAALNSCGRLNFRGAAGENPIAIEVVALDATRGPAGNWSTDGAFFSRRTDVSRTYVYVVSGAPEFGDMELTLTDARGVPHTNVSPEAFHIGRQVPMATITFDVSVQPGREISAIRFQQSAASPPFAATGSMIDLIGAGGAGLTVNTGLGQGIISITAGAVFTGTDGRPTRTVTAVLNPAQLANMFQGRAGQFPLHVIASDNSNPPLTARAANLYVYVDDSAPFARMEFNPSIAGSAATLGGSASPWPSDVTGEAVGRVDSVVVWFERIRGEGERRVSWNGEDVPDTDTTAFRNNWVHVSNAAAWATATGTTIPPEHSGRIQLPRIPNPGDTDGGDFAIVIDRNNPLPGAPAHHGHQLVTGWTAGGLNQQWSFTFDSTKLPSGPLYMHFVVFDRAGNATWARQRIVAMNDAPVIRDVQIATDIRGGNALNTALNAAPVGGDSGTANLARPGSVIFNAIRGVFPGNTVNIGAPSGEELDIRRGISPVRRPPTQAHLLGLGEGAHDGVAGQGARYRFADFTTRNNFLALGIQTLQPPGAVTGRTFRVEHVRPETGTNAVRPAGDIRAGNAYIVETSTEALDWSAVGAQQRVTQGFVFVAIADGQTLPDETRTGGLVRRLITEAEEDDPSYMPTQLFGGSGNPALADADRAEFAFRGPETFGSGTNQIRDYVHSVVPPATTLPPWHDRYALFLVSVFDGPEEDRFGDFTLVSVRVNNDDQTPPFAQLYDLNPAAAGGNFEATVNPANVTSTDAAAWTALTSLVSPTAIGDNRIRAGLWRDTDSGNVTRPGHIEPRGIPTMETNQHSLTPAQMGQVAGDPERVNSDAFFEVDTVSGRVILRGYAEDDQRIGAVLLEFRAAGTAAAPGALQGPRIPILVTAANAATPTTTGLLTPAFGRDVFFTDTVDLYRHRVEWAFVWDTAVLPADFVVGNLVVRAIAVNAATAAVDLGNATAMPSGAEGTWASRLIASDTRTATVERGFTPAANGNPAVLAATERHDPRMRNHGFPANLYMYNSVRVNIRPYVTGFIRQQVFGTSRTTQGWYAFFRGTATGLTGTGADGGTAMNERVVVTGFNLGGTGTTDTSIFITAGGTTAAGAVTTAQQGAFGLTSSPADRYRHFVIPGAARTGDGLVRLRVTRGTNFYAVNIGAPNPAPPALPVSERPANAAWSSRIVDGVGGVMNANWWVQPWNVERSSAAEGSELWDNVTRAHIWQSNNLMTGTNRGAFPASRTGWQVYGTSMSINPLTGVLHASHNEGGGSGLSGPGGALSTDNFSGMFRSTNDAGGTTLIGGWLDPVIHSDIFVNVGGTGGGSAGEVNPWVVSSFIGRAGTLQTWRDLGGLWLRGPDGGAMSWTAGGGAPNNANTVTAGTGGFYNVISTWYNASNQVTHGWASGAASDSGATDQFWHPRVVTHRTATTGGIEHIHVAYFDSLTGSIQYRYNRRGSPGGNALGVFAGTPGGAPVGAGTAENNFSAPADSPTVLSANAVRRLWTNLDGGWDNDDRVGVAAGTTATGTAWITALTQDTRIVNAPTTAGWPANSGATIRHATRSNNAGRFNDIDVTSGGFPVIVYFCETNNRLRMAISNYVMPIHAGHWHIVEQVIPNTHDGEDFSALAIGTGHYVSMRIDRVGGINRAHIAAHNPNTGSLVYISGRIVPPAATTNTAWGATGSGARNGAWVFDEAVVVDSVGTVGRRARISLDAAGNPWIAYLDTMGLNTHGGLRVAFRDTSLVGTRVKEDMFGRDISGWETMRVPVRYRVIDRQNFELASQLGMENFPTRRTAAGGTGQLGVGGATQVWRGAVGFLSDDLFRIAYWIH